MGLVRYVRIVFFSFSTVLGLLLLTGCPGQGNRLAPEEIANIKAGRTAICFSVPDTTNDYILSAISISPRGTPFNQQKYIFGSGFELMGGDVCIPDSYLINMKSGEYISRYLMTSKIIEKPARKVAAVFFYNGVKAQSVPANENEVLTWKP